MTLKDQMANDLTDVFLNTDDFADDATYFVKGSTVAGFPCTLVIGDPQPGFVQIDGGQEDRRPATAVAQRSALRTGIEAITGVARDPVKGDYLTIATGAYAGTWTVDRAQGDEGDAMQLSLVNAILYAPGAKGAREVR